MNKMSKCKMVTLAALISAFQTFPSMAVADNASAKADAKPVESAKPAEPRAPAVEAARSESKLESKSSAEPVSMITPMMERQQTIRATGYAVISTQNHKNSSQQRLMAIRASKLDAYRALTEQVYGQQLDATTTVAEMMVTSDTFRTRVQGVIYGQCSSRSRRLVTIPTRQPCHWMAE